MLLCEIVVVNSAFVYLSDVFLNLSGVFVYLSDVFVNLSGVYLFICQVCICAPV